MTARANLGRDRNKVKYAKWGFYLQAHCDGLEPQHTLKSLREVARTSTARVRGGPNQSVKLEKVSRNRVEVTWPGGVTAECCTRLLKKALGDNWRRFVTDPAGVPGTVEE